VGWRKNQSDSQKGYPKLEDYLRDLKEYEMAGVDILLQFNGSAAPPGIYNHRIATTSGISLTVTVNRQHHIRSWVDLG
jgi:hypothetical protein